MSIFPFYLKLSPSLHRSFFLVLIIASVPSHSKSVGKYLLNMSRPAEARIVNSDNQTKQDHLEPLDFGGSRSLMRELFGDEVERSYPNNASMPGAAQRPLIPLAADKSRVEQPPFRRTPIANRKLATQPTARSTFLLTSYIAADYSSKPASNPTTYYQNHFRYSDLPLELKQKILGYAFDDLDGPLPGKMRISFGMVGEIGLLPEPSDRDWALITLPFAFKQFFASKRFLEEAIPIFVLDHEIRFLEVKRAWRPEKALSRHPGPVSTTLREIFSRTTKISLDYYPTRHTDPVTWFCKVLPRLRRIDVVDKDVICWRPGADGDAHAYLTTSLFDWGEPRATLTQADLAALRPGPGKVNSVLPNDLFTLMQKQNIFFDSSWESFTRALKIEGSIPKVQLCTCVNVACGLNEKTSKLGSGVRSGLLLMYLTIDQASLEIVGLEENKSHEDIESYRQRHGDLLLFGE